MCTKAISLCLTRSWSQCGLLLTTAIAVETLLPSWSSKMSIRENQSYSEQFQIQNVLFLPEPRRRISFEAFAIPLATFCPLLPQLSCTLYNILFIEHFAAEMLPLAFFLILNYLTLLFVMVSIAVFFYQFCHSSYPHMDSFEKT